MEETNLAVLIDFENIAAGTEKEGLGRFDVAALMARVKDKGRILVARSYADWGRFSRFKQALLTQNVTMMELTSHGMQDKNRADIAMVVDALELAFTRDYVDTYVIVSGDSDFTPMVLKMRELNKRIIGIGTRRSTSRLLIQACDEFIFYDNIVQPKKQRPRRKPTTNNKGNANLTKAIDLLEDTLLGLQRENPDPVHASVVKSAMLRKSPDFNENDLGFPSFARFLETATKTGVVSIDRDRKSGGYRVFPGDEAESDRDDSDNGVDELEPWSDAYLPKNSERAMAVLEQAKLPALSASVRKDVLAAFEETTVERKKKRRKVTLGLVREDMVKNRLRRTHPELPAPLLKSVFDGLVQAGELIHRDGTAIRSTTASFHLEKDADGLNQALVQLYLAHLVDAGAEVSDTGMLAELFYGDADRRRDVEETLAWLHTAAEGSDEDNGEEDLDLDDLLVVDEAPAPKAAPAEPEEPAAEAAPEKPKRTRRKKAAAKAPAEAPADEAAVEADAKPAPRKRTRRKKADEDAPEADADAEEKPKRKRTRRKKAEEAPATDDLDSLLEIGD